MITKYLSSLMNWARLCDPAYRETESLFPRKMKARSPVQKSEKSNIKTLLIYHGKKHDTYLSYIKVQIATSKKYLSCTFDSINEKLVFERVFVKS